MPVVPTCPFVAHPLLLPGGCSSCVPNAGSAAPPLELSRSLLLAMRTAASRTFHTPRTLTHTHTHAHAAS
uniref:Putative secreted protein n=1 Tax=Anopheles marajoara TaxID=58244 RepID=A0A2M4CEM6_9DIPT